MMAGVGKFFLWLVGVLVAGALLTFGAVKVFPDLPLLESNSATSHSQIINAVERREQVVLLSLGIQGISEKSAERRALFGVEVPGSERASFIQYTFNAKLGIEGRDVDIEQTDDGGYVVQIPEFKFIGHDNVSFKLVAENNGVLSWVTPQIDPLEMVNDILSADDQEQYIASNEEVLRDQAEAFYSRIITSIDPAAQVEFEFRQPRSSVDRP